MSTMSERDSECRWTHWAIEYTHGEFSFVDWSTMRGTRADAWKAWDESISVGTPRFAEEERKHRRSGRYRAVKVAAHKFIQAAPAAASTKESDHG